MSEIWKPQDILVYKTWIEMIVADTKASDKKLSHWEDQFLISLWDRLSRHINLTELQAKKLEDMYAKYTN